MIGKKKTKKKQIECCIDSVQTLYTLKVWVCLLHFVHMFRRTLFLLFVLFCSTVSVFASLALVSLFVN